MVFGLGGREKDACQAPVLMGLGMDWDRARWLFLLCFIIRSVFSSTLFVTVDTSACRYALLPKSLFAASSDGHVGLDEFIVMHLVQLSNSRQAL